MDDDVENNSVTEINSSDIKTTHSNRSRIVIVLGLIALFVVVGIFLNIFFNTFTGEKLINGFFPNFDRTFSITINSIQKTQNHTINATFTSKGGETLVQGIMVNPARSELSVTFPSSFALASSTVLSKPPVKYGIRRVEANAYGLDAYDNTYHKIGEGFISQEIIEQIVAISPQYLMNLLSSAGEKMQVEPLKIGQNKVLRLSAFNISPSDIADQERFNLDKNIKELTVDIYTKDYLLRSFKIRFENQEIGFAFSDVSGQFDNYNQNNIPAIETPLINKFGDFVSRESVYIRTIATGEHDYLWHLWEENYFGCMQCVYRYGDNDNDSIINILEFILNSNPLKSDTNDNGVNDFDELIANRHPATSQAILFTPPYASAVSLILEVVNTEIPLSLVGTAKIRSAAISRKITFVEGYRFLVFDYSFTGPSDSGDYLTLYFENELIYKGLPIPKDGGRTARVPIEKYTGRSGKLVFVLNSYGPRDTDFFLANQNFGLSR